MARGEGPPILFVHGWMGNHRSWDRQFHALQGRYRCVALDLRGMGQSEKGDWAYTFEEFGSDVRHLIKSLALKDVTLVGRSMGVSVSLSYLEQFQDDGDVSRVVLVTGPIKLTNPNRKIFEARKRETAALGAGEKLVLGHPLAATIGDSARCMQNLEKVLFTGPIDLRHGDVYLRLGLTPRTGSSASRKRSA